MCIDLAPAGGETPDPVLCMSTGLASRGNFVAASSMNQGTGILNLCFHGIGTPGRTLEPDEELYWVEAAQFDELLDVIAKYPSVRITFDDGNASDAALALPALRRRNLERDVLRDRWPAGPAGFPATAEVRSLADSGMTWVRTACGTGRGDRSMMRNYRMNWPMPRPSSPPPPGSRSARWPARSAPMIAACSVPSAAYGFSRVYTVDGGAARSEAWLQSRYTVRADDTPADIERSRAIAARARVAVRRARR